MAAPISHFLMLPDEILLEIYKYLLNSHVLYSFYGLNERLNASIRGYFHHISLADITYRQCDYLCRSILPEIGSEIHSLLISNCRSVLQCKMFSQYFSSQMSKIFPNLQKLILICFTADQLDSFLNTLDNLYSLNQIEVFDLLTDQLNLFQRVVDTNSNRFTTIKFMTNYLDLPQSPCLNVSNLTISIQTLDKLPQLLSFIPNIRELNVTVEEIIISSVSFNQVSPLLFLTKFFLRCYDHFWTFIEYQSLLKIMPTVETLSLQLSSQDMYFVNSKTELIDILPSTVQEFNFGLRYFYDEIQDIDQIILKTFRFPLICLIDENLQQAFVHTVPHKFPSLHISSPMAKSMVSHENYNDIELFYDYHGMTLGEMFPIISRCRRIKEISIQSYDTPDEITPGIKENLSNYFYHYGSIKI